MASGSVPAAQSPHTPWRKSPHIRQFKPQAPVPSPMSLLAASFLTEQVGQGPDRVQGQVIMDVCVQAHHRPGLKLLVFTAHTSA